MSRRAKDERDRIQQEYRLRKLPKAPPAEEKDIIASFAYIRLVLVGGNLTLQHNSSRGWKIQETATDLNDIQRLVDLYNNKVPAHRHIKP